MGDHKVTPADKLPPQIINAFKTMKPGDVSGLIQIETAYTIVRLNTHTLAHKQSFAELRPSLPWNCRSRSISSLRVNLAKRLRSKAKIEVV